MDEKFEEAMEVDSQGRGEASAAAPSRGDAKAVTAPAAASPAISAGGEAAGVAKEKKPRKRDRDELGGIPKQTVRRIMKLGAEPNPPMLATDAVALVGHACELFLEKMARDAWTFASKDGRKTIKYADVSAMQQADDNLIFLELVVPPGAPPAAP